MNINMNLSTSPHVINEILNFSDAEEIKKLVYIQKRS